MASRVEGPACPSCGAATERRASPQGPLWGCSAYPRCRRAVRDESPLAGKARRLLALFCDRLPDDPLAPAAGSLLRALSGAAAERVVPFVLGELSPNGRPTFEARLRARVAAAPKRVGGRDRDFGASLSEPTPWDPATRPQRSLTLVDQGAAGGPDADSRLYAHHELRYARLNALQALVLPWVDADVNLVVAASTSSGKSLVGEMVMGAAVARGGRAAYLSPLRAVSREKHDDWTDAAHPWASKKVEILTGDYTLTEGRRAALAESDVVVMTSEMLDSKSRRSGADGGAFLSRVRALIVDEAHMISMAQRGDALECGLMRFSRLVPEARLVFLSATMPNVEELGRWATGLNGRPTVVVRSEWRPTRLRVHYETYDDRGDYQARENAKRRVAMRIVKALPGDKFLLFVHSKKAGYQIVDALGDAGVAAEFHNADLERSARVSLEDRFRTAREPRVVVATSTLAYGINMPARRVIVLGIHRGMEEVEPADVQQECGRAGRAGLDPEGDAYVLIPGSRAGPARAKYGELRPIRSRLYDEDALAFHLTAEIADGGLETEDQAVEWFGRSLAAMQGVLLSRSQPSGAAIAFGTEAATLSAEGVMRRLAKAGVLKAVETIDVCAVAGCGRPVARTRSGTTCPNGHGGAETREAARYEATPLGRVSSWLYFSPFDVADWCTNFRRVAERDLLRDDAAVAWALGRVKTAYTDQYLPKDSAREEVALSSRLRDLGLLEGRLNPSMLGSWMLLSGRVGNGLAGVQSGLRQDAERVCQALDLLDRQVLRAFSPQYSELLAVRLANGCSWTEADLCRLPGIGGKRARDLVRAGIKSVADVLARPQAVADALGAKTAAAAIRGAKGIAAAKRDARFAVPQKSGRPSGVGGPVAAPPRRRVVLED